MATSLRPFPPFFYKPTTQFHLLRPSSPIPFPRRGPPRIPCSSSSSSSSTATPFKRSRADEKKGNAKEKRSSKARIRIRLDHQVMFGESVAILGSSKELGSWKKKVPMEWTESGWVCEVLVHRGGTVEFKFVVVSGDEENVVWEDGRNRVLRVPDGRGVYDMVCHWNKTHQILELLGGDEEEGGEELDMDGDRIEEAGGVVLEGELSPFVEQWQGREISFMRPTEHLDRESQTRWDISGLEGVPLKVVEGDCSARNWWRKVSL